MVSFENCEGGFDSVFKRSRMNVASPSPETLTLAQQRQTARNRKQKLVSKLRDSGFEEDLACSPISSPAKNEISLLITSYLRTKVTKSFYFDECVFYLQLTAEARCKLVSWLIPVHKHFRLSFECCCLAVNIMDRFLASTPVAADCFQLIGVTALLLASKQVEVCSPRISHLLSLCCDVFTKEQLCNLECLILLRLNFRLSAPTLAFFLDYYTNCIEASHNLAQNVCELTLADYAFNKYPPSLTASCALRVASDFVDELCTQSVSFHDKQSLVQECTDNLKLLVSLNLETLDVMSTM
uniref:G2/mitotic-specific cyclin-B2 n=1 Tax=Neolamprologus brichardi TaxID=32507 RepID=A0A3Q4HXM5_NEOBR